jgi:hypothetical protein
VIASFLNLLDSNVPSREGDDGLRWRLKRSGIFHIRSFYIALRGSSPLVIFPWRGIWGVKAPQRVAFFVWCAAWGNILTCDNLMRQGYALVGWRCMCWCNGETVDHLLFDSPRAAELWNFVFRSFGIQWVLPGWVVDFLFGWQNWFRKHSSDVWNLVHLCLMWTVWQERNWCTSNNLESCESVS